MHSLSGSFLLSTINELCAFGPRWMGSEGAILARDFVTQQLKNSGLTPQLESFWYLHYFPSHTSLHIGINEVPCEPLGYAASTDGFITGKLVYVGNCTNAEIQSLQAQDVDLSQSILVSDNLRSFVAYPIAERVGARGFILVTTLPNNTIRCGSVRLDRQLGSIPAVSIGGEDGRQLIHQLQNGEIIEARIHLECRVEERQGENIIARVQGHSRRRLLVTAHYDSFWNGVHAMDNGSGVAGLIALAGALPSAFNNTLEFVAFGAEELGCWGAAGYAEEHARELNDIRAIVNLDTFGSNLSQLEVGVTSNLRELCQEVSAQQSTHVDCWSTPPRAASDQHVFVENGVPSIWIANCGADPHYHTPLDVPESMSAKALEIGACLGYHFVQTIGTDLG